MELWNRLPEKFLRFIQPNRIDQVLDRFNLDLTKPSTFSNISDEFSNEMNFLLNYSLGYVVCLGVGILFVLLTVAVGVIVCCCRTCCGRCGSMVPPPSRDDQKRHFKFSLCLLVLCILSTPPILFAGFSNETLKGELKEDTGFINSIFEGFVGFESYKVNTFDSIKLRLNKTLFTAKINIAEILDRTPEAVKQALNYETNIKQSLYHLKRNIFKIRQLESELDFIKDTKDKIDKKESQLQSNLKAQIIIFNKLLKNCHSARCSNANMTQFAYNGGTEKCNISLVHSVLTLGAASILNKGRTETVNKMKNLGRNVEDSISTKVKQKNQEFVNTLDSAMDRTATIIDVITQRVNFTSIGEPVLVAAPFLDKMDFYRHLIVLGLTLLLASIIGLLLVGLCLGVACGPPDGADSACSTGRAADILLTAVVFYFTFSGLIMAFCMAVFIPGGLLQNEVCRYLRNSSEVSPSLEKIGEDIGRQLALKVELNKPVDVLGIARRCREDKSLYLVINFDEYGVNIIDRLINIKEYAVESKLNDLMKLNFDFKNQNILSWNLIKTLHQLYKSFQDTKFGECKEELRLKNINLDDLNQNLQWMVSVSESLGQPVDNINLIKQQVKEISEKRLYLNQSVLSVEKSMREINPRNQYNLLRDAQKSLRSKSPDIIKNVLNSTSTEILSMLLRITRSFGNEVRYDIGRCRPGYDAVVKMVDAACVDFLQPFNVIWSSFGVCLILLTPGVWLALELAGLNRKNLGNPNRVSPDHINLEDHTTTVFVRTSKRSQPNLCK